MKRRWLDDLTAIISECWECHSPSLYIGLRYRKPQDSEDCWEIWAYPAVQEMLGGENDGQRVFSGFNFNLLPLIESIEAETVSLSTRVEGQPPEISYEGTFRGKPVWLHVCLEPPDDADATEVLDVTQPGHPKLRDKE
jgi:hypothetical protein